MDAVLSFFPEEGPGQILGHDWPIVVLPRGKRICSTRSSPWVEEAGAEKASYALKLLQSEGELTIASTGKDPQTGRMVTQEYHVQGPGDDLPDHHRH